MKDDLNRLVVRPPAEKRLGEAATPNAIRSLVGIAPKQAGKVDSEEVTVESTDGLFTFVVRVVKA